MKKQLRRTIIFSCIVAVLAINFLIAIPTSTLYLFHDGSIFERTSYVTANISALLGTEGGALQRGLYYLHTSITSWAENLEYGNFYLLVLSWIFASVFIFTGMLFYKKAATSYQEYRKIKKKISHQNAVKVAEDLRISLLSQKLY